MLKLLGAIARAIPIIIRDLAGLSGAGAIAYGSYEIYPPAGFIVGGLLAVTASVLASRGN